MTMRNFFYPTSIAVIGASPKTGTIGYNVLANILYSEVGLDNRDNGFRGEVYPVSLKSNEILGLKAYKSIIDIPGSVDLAILIVPGGNVPQVLDECGQKGCKNAIIISAGFAEYGEEGKLREQEIDRIAKKYGIRFIGPNCLGIFSTHINLNASFAASMPQKGPISMISQSGALCTAIIAYAKQEHIGFSNFVSTGNKADVEDTDLIEFFDEDPQTNCISIYMESIRDGRRFYETTRQVTTKTPIACMKVGRTEAGRKAASSHTGALAGADWAYEAAFRQAGVMRLQTMYDLFDVTRALAYQPVPDGENIAILSNAGGPGVIASDFANQIGLKLVELSQETLAKLDLICPPSWSRRNPIDIIGDADVERFTKSLSVLFDAPEVQGIILILAPASVADPLEVARHVAAVSKGKKKPIIASFVGMIGEASEDFLESSGVPTIEFPERAVKAMHALVQQRRLLNREERRRTLEQVGKISAGTCQDPKCMEIFENVKKEGRNLLTLNEARTVLGLFGIPMSRSCIVNSEEDAVEGGRRIGYPVAMKISSPDIMHKTETGGVMLDIRTPDEAREAFTRILKNVRAYDPRARIEGVVMDHMVKGPEVIIGVSYDPQFGPMIMFGLGGTMVEIYKDVSFRLIPLTELDALEMIDEIKGKSKFMGARGGPAADLDELAKLIVRVSEAVNIHPHISEIDINPLVITNEGITAIDARILLHEEIPGT